MEQELAHIQNISPTGERSDAYVSLVSKSFANNQRPEAARLLVRAAIQDSPIISRRILQQLSSCLSQSDAAVDRDDVLSAILGELQTRATSFEEWIKDFRMQLSGVYEGQERWDDAAKALMGIPLDRAPDDFKLNIYVRIIRLLLEDEDSVTAETFLNRAHPLIHLSKDRETQLAYSLSQARIYDSQRRFYDASVKYHQISFAGEVDVGERMQMLSAAVTCAVLAPAGPQRSRLLAALHRDERSAELASFSILSKVFLEHIIRPSEIESFAKDLQPHHLAKLSTSSYTTRVDDNDQMDVNDVEMIGNDDSSSTIKSGPQTVLDRSFMEHNILAASRIYNNITLSGLGTLLSLRPSAAEELTRTMIIQGRLKASIDQVDSLITFDPKAKELEGVISNVALATGEVDDSLEDVIESPEIYRWDEGLRRTSHQVEELAAQCGRVISQNAS